MPSSTQNIVVAIRVRPLSHREKSRGCSQITEVDGKSNSVTITPTGVSEPKTFTFDHCYDDVVSQEKVYEEIGAPTVSKSLEGYNSTIFAYGQTGSGKTHSMMGNDENPGIIPQLGKDLFSKIDQKLEQSKGPGSDTKYMVTWYRLGGVQAESTSKPAYVNLHSLKIISADIRGAGLTHQPKKQQFPTGFFSAHTAFSCPCVPSRGVGMGTTIRSMMQHIDHFAHI